MCGLLYFQLLKELLTQLPAMFEGNKNTQTALGPALQAAIKLLVSIQASL